MEEVNKESSGGGWVWNPTDWRVLNQALLFCMTLEKSLFLSELQIPNLSNEDYSHKFLLSLWGGRPQTMDLMSLEQCVAHSRYLSYDIPFSSSFPLPLTIFGTDDIDCDF